MAGEDLAVAVKLPGPLCTLFPLRAPRCPGRSLGSFMRLSSASKIAARLDGVVGVKATKLHPFEGCLALRGFGVGLRETLPIAVQ